MFRFPDAIRTVQKPPSGARTRSQRFSKRPEDFETRSQRFSKRPEDFETRSQRFSKRPEDSWTRSQRFGGHPRTPGNPSWPHSRCRGPRIDRDGERKPGSRGLGCPPGGARRFAPHARAPPACSRASARCACGGRQRFVAVCRRLGVEFLLGEGGHATSAATVRHPLRHEREQLRPHVGSAIVPLSLFVGEVRKR